MARPVGSTNPTATRQRLVEAAGRRFSQSGYSGTSLAQIAGDVGMTAPSLLYHFASKEKLFDEVLRETWRSVRASLEPVLDQDLELDELLAGALSALADVEHSQTALFAQLHAVLLSGDGIGAAPVNDTLLPLIDDIEAAIRRAARTAPPDAPIREALLYVVLAHTAEQQLGRLAPQELERLQLREVQFAAALLRAALEHP